MLGGIPGVAPANVVIIKGGVVGHNAAKIAVGLGAHVTIIDKNLNRLREIDDIYSSQVVTLASNVYTAREALRLADLVIGSVLVDVAIDQGGCFETSRPTTHTNSVLYIDIWTDERNDSLLAADCGQGFTAGLPGFEADLGGSNLSGRAGVSRGS